jgi:hypothetical protein
LVDCAEHYTGQQARSCSGEPITGELVLSYSAIPALKAAFSRPTPAELWKDWVDDGRGGKIRADARERSPRELLGEVFDMLETGRSVLSGRLMSIDGRTAREFVKPHELRPGDYSADPIPPEMREALWIDVESLQVVRWNITRSGVPVNYGYVFVNDPTLDMRPPHDLKAPDCVR